MSTTAGDTAVSDDEQTVGPPMMVVAAGFLSLVTSLALALLARDVPFHLVGYLTGAIIPVLVIGVARRADLDRRSDPSYRAHPAFRGAFVVLGVGAVLTAGLHIWPLATEFAS